LKESVRLGLVLLGGVGLALVVTLVLQPSDGAAAIGPVSHPPAPAEMPGMGRVSSDAAIPQVLQGDPFANCRYGVAGWGSQIETFDVVSNLGVGWYLDFSTHITPLGPVQAEYAQMIRLHQGSVRRQGTNTCGPDYAFTVSPALTDTALGARVDANPGVLWIVGNEPERIGQDDICPQQYAEAYHDVYHYIKGRDPTAQIAVAGLVEVTPSRLQYLDIAWDTYYQKYGIPMPVDVWAMHIYILSETSDGDAHIALGTDPDLAIPFSYNCADSNSYCHAEHDDVDIFVEHVEAMREWMLDHGQRDKPLILTEYSLLKPYHFYGTCPEGTTTCPPEGLEGCFCDENKETFHPQRVVDFMEATFNYLMSAADPRIGYPADENRLVQQWLWYSLQVDPPLPAHCSNLLAYDTSYYLVVPGQAWQDYVHAIPAQVNVLPSRVLPIVAHSATGTGTVTVTLTAEVRNSGNVALTDTVTVTFYSNQGLTQTIGVATFSGLTGCARRAVVVTATWEGLGAGAHPYWVLVDSGQGITETSEVDNVGTGVVLVDPRQVFFPLVPR